MSFDQYAEMLAKVAPINLYFNFNQRIDIVFDTYVEGSLRTAMWLKKGQGLQRRVAGTNQCPRRWDDFLKDTTNKKELNKFLAQKLTTFTYPEGKQLFLTCEGNVLSNTAASMDDSDHEEADSRMMLHVQHALTQGMNRIKILTNDTDVIIIALGVYHVLRSKYVFDDIVVEFALQKKHRTISLKAVAESLGEPRCKALPFFHSLDLWQTER